MAIFFIAFFAALAGLAYPAVAHPGTARLADMRPSVRMAEGPQVMAPIAHMIFCNANRQECQKSARVGPVPMDAGKWRDLDAVNARFNRSIQPVSDQARYGEVDVWTIGQDSGDCEEYAIAKRSALIARGWPAASILLAVVLDQRGAGHAVVVARTDRGDFVLDNLTAEIRTWDKTGYTWIKQQSSADPRIWVRIAGAPA